MQLYNHLAAVAHVVVREAPLVAVVLKLVHNLKEGARAQEAVEVRVQEAEAVEGKTLLIEDVVEL